MIKKIQIEIIPHSQQRYETVGDWVILKAPGYESDILEIKVSDSGDLRSNLAVAIHEMIEATECEIAGIKETDIFAFDNDYEDNRLPDDESEPGDAKDAPYRKQHQLATAVEREYIESSGMSWNEYSKLIDSLSKE